MKYSPVYTSPRGNRYFDREDYEQALQRPVYGPRSLAALYGPVSRFCLESAPQKIDNWLRDLDVKGEAMQEPSATAHKDMPKGVFLCGFATGLRHAQRTFVKPWMAMAAGTALVMGAASMLGAGLLVGALAAAVALPLSTGLGALSLMAACGIVRAPFELLHAAVNIPAGYGRRKEFFEVKKADEECENLKEKNRLGQLCQALFDDEKLAEKAAPADRANWIYGLARHFPEEFMDAAKKIEKRDAAKARKIKAAAPSASA